MLGGVERHLSTMLFLHSRRPILDLYVGIAAVREGPLRGFSDFSGQKDGGCNEERPGKWP